MSQACSMPEGITTVKPDYAQGHECAWQSFGEMGQRATERYQLLVQQLIAEDPDRSQAEIGELLGVDQTHVSRLASGKRKAGIDVIELAIRGKLRISPAFFFAKLPTEPHYRDFQGAHKLPPSMGYPALYRFLKMAEDGGISLTAREKALLTDQEWDGDPSAETYMLMLQALRTIRAPEDTVVRLRKEPTKPREARRGRS